MEVTTKNAEETQKLGEEIGNNLVDGDKSKAKHQTRNTNVFALVGNLGSGKTTFVQGLAKGLGIKQRIISPTYRILRKYDIPPITIHLPANATHQALQAGQSLFTSFYHVDLYRLEEDVEKEIRNLGLEEIWSDPKNVVVIEWAEKARDIIPKNATWVEFENLGENRRKIKIKKSY